MVVVYLSSFLVHSRLSGDGNGSFNEKITETVQYANAFRDNFVRLFSFYIICYVVTHEWKTFYV